MRQKRPTTASRYELRLATTPLPDDFPFENSGRYVQHDRSITALHLHQVLELGYCHSGSGIFVVEDKVLPYQAGCVSVINEHEMHLAQSTPGTTSTWTFMTVDPTRLLAGAQAAAAILSTADLSGRSFNNIVTPAQNPQLCRLLEQLAEELPGAPQPGHREAVRGLVLAIMARLHRLPGRCATSENRRVPLLRLAPALSYLGRHYHQAIDIPTLAATCGYSPTHFRRQFTEAFGQNPLTYVVRFRLEKAAALLRDSETSVLAVALRCGFNSLSSFQRHFRAVFHCTPRTWRRRPPAFSDHAAVT